MSATADVTEMQGLCEEIVRLGSRDLQKQQVPWLAELIGVTENRALEFLRAKARRVDSWEKDKARQLRDELKAAERRQRDHEHFIWLKGQISGMGGRSVDALEHLLRSVGYSDSPLEVPPSTDADEHANQEHWGR